MTRDQGAGIACLLAAINLTLILLFIDFGTAPVWVLWALDALLTIAGGMLVLWED